MKESIMDGSILQKIGGLGNDGSELKDYFDYLKEEVLKDNEKL